MRVNLVTACTFNFRKPQFDVKLHDDDHELKLYNIICFGTFGVREDDERRRRDERKYGKMPQGKFAHY